MTVFKESACVWQFLSVSERVCVPWAVSCDDGHWGLPGVWLVLYSSVAGMRLLGLVSQ